MDPKIAIPATLAAIAAASSGSASAQETPYLRQHVEPPRRAFELTLGTGYTQGFGMLHEGVGMPSVATEGVALNVGLGYRIDPHWMVGVAGEYQELNAQRAASVRGVATGIQAAYHFTPYDRLDPWVALGAGYRWLWERHNVPASVTVTNGLQMARLTLGLDLRASRGFAIAPVIGGDLNLFLSQGDQAIQDPRVSTFVYAGLQGRFDIGGQREPEGVTEWQAPNVMYMSPSVSVSSDIASACGLKQGDAPAFAFDDSDLNDADRWALNSVAACFATGALKGTTMRVIGRADPRGSA
ncbi:MAG: autotransporter domain-containing protein, partial [Myxococcota bacterium]|nr:autotransporter domain-containing protein [Myxococcota bacterium]